jgi:hypothetical protein
MQLVPGIGLEKLLDALHLSASAGAANSTVEWNGEQLLAIVDKSASMSTALDPSALHDREALDGMDAIEATAWFGGRLAEALDFAHRHGVLHRDIKPANILVNPYGRPLLADFNISSQPIGSEPSGDEMFGGTFAYMSPEHLDAFNPEDRTGSDAVTARSDIYSLGLVLRQLLTGKLEYARPKKKKDMVEALREMAHERRQPRPDCEPGPPCARQTLQRTLHRCVAPDPADRFASGSELAAQLDGCRRLRLAERQLPRPPKILAPALRRPMLWLIVLVLLPQVLASAVNIAYNSKKIVDALSPPQKELFVQLVIGYNAIVYPVALVLFVIAVWPVWRSWGAMSRAEPLASGQIAAARRQALRLPLWIAGLTAMGWFPGGFLFPLMLFWLEPPLDPHVAAHFVVSFWMSGLIALAYSLCGAQFVVLRAIYPVMWRDVTSFHQTACRELETMTRRLSWVQFLAVLIPLVAVVLLVFFGGEADTFRGLVAGLIALGIVGLLVAGAVTRSLSQVVVALTKH